MCAGELVFVDDVSLTFFDVSDFAVAHMKDAVRDLCRLGVVGNH